MEQPSRPVSQSLKKFSNPPSGRLLKGKGTKRKKSRWLSLAPIQRNGISAAFGCFAALLVLVFLTGGGSRDDIQSLIVLRPVALLLGAYAATRITADQWRAIAVPAWLLIAIAAVLALQLIPLPPGIWTSLPGRELHAQALLAAGLGDAWHPMSLSPAKTLNALMSLSVPMAALLLFGLLDFRARQRGLWLIGGLCVFSAVLGVAQLLGSAGGPLYFYRVTNGTSLVGVFANRNHQAFLLAFAGLLSAAILLFNGERQRGSLPPVRLMMLTGCIAMVTLLIALTGSRAGLLLNGVSVVIIAYMMRVAGTVAVSRSAPAKKVGANRYLWLVPVVGAVLATAVSIFMSRSEGFKRIMESESQVELRGDVLPQLVGMLWSYFPFGAGFGSFENVYRQFETVELIGPSYLNNAHNDWLQVLIEGGVPGALLLAAGIGWVALRSVAVLRAARSGSHENGMRLLAAGFFVLLALASVFDYPARVPIIMALAAVMAGILASPVASRSSAASAA